MSVKEVVQRFMDEHKCSEQDAIDQITFLMNYMPKKQKGPAVTGPSENNSYDSF